jgi:hypothetical protein
MKNGTSWRLTILLTSTVIACLCLWRSQVSAQDSIEFGVGQEYGAIALGPGQETLVENTNNSSNLQMQVETDFIGNDGMDLIPTVSATIPPNQTSEIRFAPPLLPVGCTPEVGVPCASKAFRVKVVAIVTTGRAKPPLDFMCTTLLSTQSIVGAGGTAFSFAPIWRHAWPGSGQPPAGFSNCLGER